MKHVWSYVVSAVGLLVLFVSFVMFTNPDVPAWGTFKLTDALAIVGGVLFIAPIYRDSVARKTADGAPNRVIWATLPPVGVVVVCVGIMIPNAVSLFGLFPLADVFYLIGCLMILPVFAYPPASLRRDMLEDLVEEQVDETIDATAGRGRKS
ncbi:hypothetical protein [Bifidobacterium eulemuris]|uniref:Permease n=1 Tax=Bifidobacterium eulemuris TaxID=1765219 RepID=A0A261GB90_9BIFI|nr:hypothetical protein [Bifidobacterium eulemuris]OZG68664.1 hypothetical protein BEUL_0974 [Bifidobacterium eulemuris]QOL32778.1 permease [Bifidobacterium eulemuris]